MGDQGPHCRQSKRSDVREELERKGGQGRTDVEGGVLLVSRVPLAELRDGRGRLGEVGESRQSTRARNGRAEHGHGEGSDGVEDGERGEGEETIRRSVSFYFRLLVSHGMRCAIDGESGGNE